MVILLLVACDEGPTSESRPPPDSPSGDTADSAPTTDTSSGETGDTGPDADGDGYRSDDCDDADPLTYPGAQEWCDEVDQDCDGEPLAPGVCALTQPLSTRAHDLNPEWLYHMYPIRDVTGDGLDDVLGANSAGTTGIMAGTGNVDDLRAWDWLQEWQPTMDCLRNPPGVDVGDIDGDGFNDVAIEAPDCVGGVVIAWGPVDRSEASGVLTEWPGPDPSYDFTYLRVADVNGDGAIDLLRAPKLDETPTLEVFFGGSRVEAVGYISLTSGTEEIADRAGDIDGDGLDDVILTPWDTNAFWMSTSGWAAETVLSQVDLDGGAFMEEQTNGPVGAGAAPSWLAVGDWSGDGHDDVILLAGGSGVGDPGYLLYYDDLNQGEVFATGRVENDISYRGNDNGPRFATGGGILWHDDVPVALYVTSDETTASTVLLPDVWIGGTALLSEVDHFAISDQVTEGADAFRGQGDAWGRGDLDGDGWSDILGTVCSGSELDTCSTWSFGPFDDIPWGQSQYW